MFPVGNMRRGFQRLDHEAANWLSDVHAPIISVSSRSDNECQIAVPVPVDVAETPLAFHPAWRCIQIGGAAFAE